MFLKLFFVFFVFLSQTVKSSSQDLNFTYNGFRQAKTVNLKGLASITRNGLLKLTNFTTQSTGHAFYTEPVRFKTYPNANVSSFSTTFVFAIVSGYPTYGGHGLAFVVVPTNTPLSGRPGQFLGLFNDRNNGNYTNHVFGVELDTILSNEFGDINDNHVGIDINSLRSEIAEPAGYWDDTGRFMNLSLISRKRMQVWIDYNSFTNQIDVTMAPFKVDKPKKPLLSLVRNLSPVFSDTMYIGFSSSTDNVPSEHYVLGWSFQLNREAPVLVLSKLPKLPRSGPSKVIEFVKIGVPLIGLFMIFSSIFLAIFVLRRKRKFAEELEDWETEFGRNRFRFKDLYYATKGFKNKELLGVGGFGRVYRGIMPTTKREIAVKRVSHDSRQGIKEFVAEIVSVGRMSHRNLVPLLGYCRRKDELLLVYDYMPNGSLDKYLHNNPKVTLGWKQRFNVISGVASGLFYLHEGWEQVVVHRDVKASNVLLDAELNARLGDFGLARLYNHGSDPQTTCAAGTFGYLAPEHIRTGKATTATDVYAFGVFLLEVSCGRRPIQIQSKTEETFLLVDWVLGFWQRGNLLDAKDPNLGSDYNPTEVELVLKLGLSCSQPDPQARPSMRDVLYYLRREATLPDLKPLNMSENDQMFVDHAKISSISISMGASSITDSVLSEGR